MTEPLRGWMIRTGLCAAVFSLLLPQLARAQSESDLKTFFEGRRVTVKLDMPGTSDGIDVHVAAAPAIDLQDYVQDLNRYGVAIRAGESVTVTLVKTKRDLVEFQLNGGGFGTFGDDTSTINGLAEGLKPRSPISGEFTRADGAVLAVAAQCRSDKLLVLD